MAEEQNRPTKRGGFIKRLALLLLFLVMGYLSVHVYFMWLPVNQTNPFSEAVMKAEVSGVKLFPAIQPYKPDDIAGRKHLLEGGKINVSPLALRLKTAIDRNQPVTFTEEEVNHWLRKRLQVKQTGYLAPYVKVRGVWVNFTPGEVEIVIERELPKKMVHVVSLFMKFESSDRKFSIQRHASRVGRVKAPGGFARLVMPSYSKMAEELAEELKLYKDDSLTSDKKLKIHDIKVEHGKITLDPRLKTKKES